MFAGTDGGYSKHGNGGYELGNLCFGSIIFWFPVLHSEVTVPVSW